MDEHDIQDNEISKLRISNPVHPLNPCKYMLKTEKRLSN